MPNYYDKIEKKTFQEEHAYILRMKSAAELNIWILNGKAIII